jgi:hypothetical protein
VKIQRRAGHEDIDTTLGYIREAENRTAGFGTVFPRCPWSCSVVSLQVQLHHRCRRAIRTEKCRAKTVVPAAGFEPGAIATANDNSRQFVTVSSEREQFATSDGVSEAPIATPVDVARWRSTEAAMWAWHDRALAAELEGT